MQLILNSLNFTMLKEMYEFGESKTEFLGRLSTSLGL